MHVINFIAQHFNNIELEYKLEKVNTICAFTGEKISEGYRLKDIISSSFTDYEYIKFQSEHVSRGVGLVLSSRLINGKSGLRNYSYFVTQDEIRILKSNEVEEYLLKEKPTPFVFCITFNGKKHTSFKAIINYSSNNFTIQTDIAPVLVKKKDLDIIYPILKNRYTIIDKNDKKQKTFFTKDEILYGCNNYSKIEKYGINIYYNEENVLKYYRNTMLIKLLTFILQKQIKE